MAEIIGKIPEFTSDTPSEETGTTEEVKEAAGEKLAEEGKETPAELPAAEQPPAAAETPTSRQDSGSPSGQDALSRAVQGLQNERTKLLREISELKGQRREFKREELIKIEERIDELKDLNPADVSLIERVLRAKGYVTKEESHRMFYDAVKQEELGKFLEKYPEYKPENDASDVNWSALQRELGYYRMPEDPHLIADVLERAHRGIVRLPTDRVQPVKKRQAELASVGAGGTQRSSSRNTLDSHKRAMLEAGGWSEEEIKNIEKRLPE